MIPDPDIRDILAALNNFSSSTTSSRIPMNSQDRMNPISELQPLKMESHMNHHMNQISSPGGASSILSSPHNIATSPAHTGIQRSGSAVMSRDELMLSRGPPLTTSNTLGDMRLNGGLPMSHSLVKKEALHHPAHAGLLSTGTGLPITMPSYKRSYPHSSPLVAGGIAGSAPVLYNDSFGYGSRLPTMTGQMHQQQGTMSTNTSTALHNSLSRQASHQQPPLDTHGQQIRKSSPEFDTACRDIQDLLDDPEQFNTSMASPNLNESAMLGRTSSFTSRASNPRSMEMHDMEM